jgi:hypothetical protein
MSLLYAVFLHAEERNNANNTGQQIFIDLLLM